MTFDASGHKEALRQHLLVPGGCIRACVIGTLAGTLQESMDWSLEDILKAIQPHTQHEQYDACVAAFQNTVAKICPNPAMVGTLLMDTPEYVGLFLKHPRVLQLYTKNRDLPKRLLDYAMTLHYERRHDPLVMVALFIQNGLSIKHPVGKETLSRLSKKPAKIQLCAAAAVIAQKESPGSDISALASLVESLCTFQKKITHGIL